MVRPDFLKRRVELKSPLFEHEGHVHRGEHVVQGFQPPMVLVLQRFVQLVVPMHAPRRLQFFSELGFQGGENRPNFLHSTFPRLFLTHQVVGKQVRDFFRERSVPLSQPPVFIGQRPRHALQLAYVGFKRGGVVPGDDLP